MSLVTLVLAAALLAPRAQPDESSGPGTAAAGSAARAALASLDGRMQGLMASALAVWISGARDAALERGVEAMPAHVRAALDGHVPADILDRARWRVDEGLSVEQAVFRMGNTPAVTLDHVVVFATAERAADPKLWAHEIHHVVQYDEWGVGGFAERYVADDAAVEQAAWAFRWDWMKATGRVPAP